MLTNAVIWKISILVGVSVLVAFASGYVLASVMMQRALGRFLMSAVAKVRVNVQTGDPRALVESAGVQALSQSIARNFLRVS